MGLSRELIESDRAYFDRGARLVGLPGAVLAHMPAFRNVPAAAVVHRIAPEALLPDPLTWAVAVETVAADLRLSRSRIHLDKPAPQLELALTMLGYRSRVEWGLMRPAAATRSKVELVPVRGDDDWSRKLALHADAEEGSDGYPLDPTHWVGFEKAKQVAGYFTLYLAQRDGVPCGAIGCHEAGKLLRVAHLIVAPMHRRRGAAAAILDAVASLAHARGMVAVGCFALPGAHGDQLYRANGFVDVVTQVGWDRVLTSQVPARLAARARMHAYS